MWINRRGNLKEALPASLPLILYKSLSLVEERSEAKNPSRQEGL
jgi:hypothetical protein